MSRRTRNLLTSKNSKHDDFIVANYHKYTKAQIASLLGIPEGSVIARYHIITRGTRRWNNETDSWERALRAQPSMPKLKFLGEK